MSVALSGPGFILQVGSAAGNGGSFITVAEVKDITGPAVSLDVIDVTNQDSPGGFEEIIPSIRRAGDVDFDVNFNPTNTSHDDTTGLWYLAKNKVKRGWRLWLQDEDDTYIAFDAYVVGLQMKAPVAGVLAGTTKLRVTGQPSFQTGTPPT